MKTLRFSAHIAIIAVAGLLQFGCSSGDGSDINKEREALKKLPPPTADQLKQGFARMGDRYAAAKQADIDHAKADPAWAAKVNADRAKANIPLIGQ